MENPPKIAVALLNYNQFEHTVECLASLRKSTYESLSIIVIDNASTDDSVKKLKAIIQKETLMELPVNGGYSYGNNVAIEHAFSTGAQYVFVVNNDIVVDQDCIEDLIQAASSDETIGILGPKVLFYSKPDTIDNAGIIGSIPRARYLWVGNGEKDTGQYEKLIDILYQDGCAILLSKACYDKIGGFDQWLWGYFEESDLCMRARSAGFRVCCLQKAKVWHKGSAELGKDFQRKPHAVYYIIRNSYIFHRRYAGSWIKRISAISILLSRTPKYLFSILIRGKRRRLKNVWMLLAATLLGLITSTQRPSDIFAPIKAVKHAAAKKSLEETERL